MESMDTVLTSLTFTLGQIIKYMLDEQRKYGFITTYEQTIFLKQELVGKEWVIPESLLDRERTNDQGTV